MGSRKLILTFLPALAALSLSAQTVTNYSQSVIVTVAGRDWIVPPPGGPATASPLGNITSVAVDANGLLYIADPQNNVVFQINSAGNIYTFAGNGIQGFSGEGGPATNASLSLPSGIAFDSAGNLYIADQGNQRIRKVNTSGIIQTIAGTGVSGFSGDGGPALSAQLLNPSSVVVDASGNVYFSDNGNNRVRKIAPTGNISTVAGDGTLATLSSPKDIALDSQGNLYVADFGNSVIRKLSGGALSIYAGRANLPGNYGDGGAATAAKLNSPWGLSFDSAGDLFFTDSGNNTIREVTAAGTISTIAGNGKGQYAGDGSAPLSASFFVPAGLLVLPGGHLYLADRGNQRVRQFVGTGAVSTVAGNDLYRVVASNASPTQTFLFGPQGIAVGSIAGDLLIAESRGNAIRDISITGQVLKEAGLSLVGGITADGVTGANTLLNTPYGVTKGADGTIYYADTGNNVVRAIAVDGTVHTVAGVAGMAGYNGDQQAATTAWLNQPRAVLVDIAGNIYIADTGNNRIRLVDPSGNMNTYAGTGTAGFSGDGGAATAAQISAPYGLAFFGNSLYFADQGNHRIRMISTSHMMNTVAGTGVNAAPNGENGPATSANIPSPFGIVFDTAGDMYYSDNLYHEVRVISKQGIVTTIAGNQRPGFQGDGGLATAALLNSPAGLAIGPTNGYLYIADSGNDRVRAIIPVQPTLMTSTSNISLTASGGLTNNQNEILNVTALLNGTPLTGLAYTTSTNITPDWLVVTPSSGTLPQSLLLSVNATSLSPGTYSGNITITAPGANPPFISANISATVGPTLPPQLVANTTQISQSVQQGAATTSTNISLANNGSGTINFTATAQTVSGGNWLSLPTPSGSFGNSGPYSLVVNITPSQLAPGVYRGNVVVSGTSASGPITAVTIPVALTVSASPHVTQLTQGALNFRAVTTGSSPLPQSFGIENVGQGTMNWTATVVDSSGASVPWLSLSASSGSATANGAASMVSVTVTPLRLTPGDYYALVQINSDADDSPQTVTVLMTVLGSSTASFPDIQTTSLVFTAPAGTVPSSQVINIAAVGPANGAAISYTSTAVTLDGAPWYAEVPRTNSIQVGSPDRIVVQPDFTLLQPGTYYGTISLLFQDGSTRTITILSVVTAAGAVGSYFPAASCSSSKLDVQFSPPLLQGSNAFTAYAGQQNTLSAKVLFDCSGANFVSGNGQVTVYFSDGEPSQSLTYNSSTGAWTTIWSPTNIAKSPVSLQVTATGFNGASPAAGQSSTFVATLASGAVAPLVSAGGVVSAASFQADVPIGVGGLITIFGNQLVGGNAGQAGAVPLPTNINGTQVLLQNQPLPILYASNGQINVQVPYETNVNVPQNLVVERSGAVSAPFSIQVASVQPAIFLASANGQAIIVNAANNVIASPGNAVTAGDVIIIYCTGLGPTTPFVETGAAATAPAYITTPGITATIGGQNATLYYAGLTPGFPGLYQINALVPPGATGNAVPVVVTLAGQVSPTATIAIQ
jgi:uncharacterized protein (TIGR03437 family)